MSMFSPTPAPQAQVKMFAPNGAEITLPLNLGQWQAQLRRYEQMGLLPVPPDEGERERRNQVAMFVIREHVNDDDTTTPVVDLYFRHRNGYTDRMRSMRVYLNTDRDRKRFESAFAVRLDKIPVYDGTQPLDLSRKLKKNLGQFIQHPRIQVWAVWRLNPAAESEEAPKGTPKRIFIRWESHAHDLAHRLPAKMPSGGTRRPRKQGNGAGGLQQERAYAATDDHIVAVVAEVWGVEKAQAARSLHQSVARGTRMTVRQARAWAEKHPFRQEQETTAEEPSEAVSTKEAVTEEEKPSSVTPAEETDTPTVGDKAAEGPTA